ncbi:hypothetical protein NDU88_002432 [Pleurodeles waltl]|uniref:Uncharacterized protein n=1 Tax=Pleurodeles waltl TaxID=8319 RepID=A0AAV7Q728_PLEWA|nr:hypothetical protein NDU88_002432 [Pleurodeles waltl]
MRLTSALHSVRPLRLAPPTTPAKLQAKQEVSIWPTAPPALHSLRCTCSGPPPRPCRALQSTPTLRQASGDPVTAAKVRLPCY